MKKAIKKAKSVKKPAAKKAAPKAKKILAKKKLTNKKVAKKAAPKAKAAGKMVKEHTRTIKGKVITIKAHSRKAKA